MAAPLERVAAARGLERVEVARDRILGQIPGPLEPQVLPVEAALGRVLAAPVSAALTLPPWDNSAMDGYALVAADVSDASEAAPIRLSVAGEVTAGVAATTAVSSGRVVRIATGAPLPAGADAVVPVEATTPLDSDGSAGSRGRDATGPLPAAVLVHEATPAGANVRRAGSDVSEGDIVLQAGVAISPRAVAVIAGSGTANVSVHRRPRVAILATGDEIRSPGEPLGGAGIPDANGPGLRALATAAGAEVIDLGIARDDLEDATARLRSAMARGADAIVVSGGVSVGPFDVVKLAFESIGRIELWRVAVQPGKPFVFGTAPRADGGPPVLLFGLPGNPVSTFVTFELFVRPAVARLAGRRQVLRDVDRGVLLDEASKSPGRRAFLRVTADRDAAGRTVRDDNGRVLLRLARGPAGQGSHVLSALASADGLAVVLEEVDVHPAGGEVELWWLDRA
ncbi:MAG: molybdopterin molybdotransferase MoeA [Chloroflexi bacterium]|nr:molybdopterin molybdotransferase MoeA [Chloroflexota bacterium]